MMQPRRSDGTLAAPGMVCVMRCAIQGDPGANAQWERWRDYWLENWGLKKVLAEPSMFWTMTAKGVARMEVDNDDFLDTAPTESILEILASPLQKAWDIKTETLTYDKPIQTTSTATHSPQPAATPASPDSSETSATHPPSG